MVLGDPRDRSVRGEISFTSRDLRREEIVDMLRLRPNLKILAPTLDSYARAIGLFDLAGVISNDATVLFASGS